MTTSTQALASTAAGGDVATFQAEVKNSFAVLTAAAVTLATDADRMSPERLKYMLELVARRTVELQALVVPVVTRMQ